MLVSHTFSRVFEDLGRTGSIEIGLWMANENKMSFVIFEKRYNLGTLPTSGKVSNKGE